MDSMSWDVVVVGGGPGGSTVGGLLARRGYRVLLIEREKFPRYHIGESLVPGIMPVLKELGLYEKALQQGFTRKYGVTLLWGRHREPWSVYFGEAGPFAYTFQVCRSEFDSMLLKHARALGATVLEETKVSEFLFEDGRCVGVRYAASGGEPPREARARFVIDASGQSHLLGRALDLIEWDEDLKNLAVWTYFSGARLYEGRDAGNILVENLPDGWLWLIPLHDGTQSVGWVTPHENARAHEGRLGQLLLDRIEQSVEARRMLAPAQRVAAFHSMRDWSYRCRRFHGPGFLLVGDAAGFVDPLFSTGVFLAMNGGSLAATVLDHLLRHPKDEERMRQRYEAIYRQFLDVVFSFVHYFYDASKDKEVYWAHAQELVDPLRQMSARQDFIHLISGLGGLHTLKELSEPLPAARPEPRRRAASRRR
ncbi:tryptophan halogenase [Vitiosangium sp. GDMCC 1.1324]|nr:tryptophan halogenase [Vitiosangium sp. GDMCC 1.1324]